MGTQGAANTAVGFGAGNSVVGDNNIAIGNGAGSDITASNSISIGTGAAARFDNSTAIGAGATTERVNQQAFGTASNTYTMAGLNSAGSKAAQGTPTHLVTANTSGDLASYSLGELGIATTEDLAGFATKGDLSNVQTQINSLARRDDKLAEGIAATVSLAQPILRSGQHFGMTAGWGGYDGANAVGFSAAGVIKDNLLRPGSGTLAIYGGVGVGTSEGEAAGRGGVSFGW
jgi:trimeric autotransporter adhesin